MFQIPLDFINMCMDNSFWKFCEKIGSSLNHENGVVGEQYKHCAAQRSSLNVLLLFGDLLMWQAYACMSVCWVHICWQVQLAYQIFFVCDQNIRFVLSMYMVNWGISEKRKKRLKYCPRIYTLYRNHM